MTQQHIGKMIRKKKLINFLWLHFVAVNRFEINNRREE